MQGARCVLQLFAAGGSLELELAEALPRVAKKSLLLPLKTGYDLLV